MRPVRSASTRRSVLVGHASEAEQLSKIDLESACQPAQGPQGRISFARLDLGDVRAVHPGSVNEVFLGPSTLLAQLLHAYAERPLDSKVLEGSRRARRHSPNSGHASFV